MSKSSKLLKLLSASAIVAGGNFYALADCEICGGHDHELSKAHPCPNFDYAGFAKEIGREDRGILDSSDKWNLATQAKQNPWDAKKYITTPRSTVVSFKTPADNTPTPSSVESTTISKSNTREMGRQENSVISSETPTGNTPTPSGMESATNSESDTGEMRRQERLQAKAKEREEYREKRRQQHSEERNSDERRNLHVNRRYDRFSKKTAAKAYENSGRRATDLQNLFDENKASEEEARLRRPEPSNVMTETGGKRKEQERIADEQEVRKEEKSGDEIPSSDVAGIEKIQSVVRGRLARKKAAKLKEEQRNREAAAKKIADAWRVNMERKKAKRKQVESRDQIETDNQFAKRLQAKYNAEETQNETDEGQPQGESDTEGAPMPVGYTEGGEIAQRLQQEEEERIARENFTAEAQRTEETLTATAGQGATLSADDEVEDGSWNLPQDTAYYFHNYNHRSQVCCQRAEKWAHHYLEELSIRKIECILWLVSYQYNNLQGGLDFAPDAQMAEDITKVDAVFSYRGTDAGVMNVYNAFHNTDPSSFWEDLKKLNRSDLDGVLYQVAFRYMQLLMPEHGRKAARVDFVDLARSVFKYFGERWEADDVQFVRQSEDFCAAPLERPDVRVSTAETARTDKGIVETEAPETETWNPPYRVYYTYCKDLKRGLHPSSKSMKRFQDKMNREQLYRDELSKLSIRRLEALIYYAAGAYKYREEKHLSELNRAVKDVLSVFRKDTPGGMNAREENVFSAFEKLADKPNNNPISMQPFGKGLDGLTAEEQERAFIDMAITYRRKLNEGKVPANMAFVNFADEVCKSFSVDDFVKGKDKVNSTLKFEEFKNEAKPTATPENNNWAPTISTEDLEAPSTPTAGGHVISDPEEFVKEQWYIPVPSNWDYNSDDFVGGLRGLSIRRLEAVMYLAACQYSSRSPDEVRGSNRAWRIAKRMYDLFPNKQDVSYQQDVANLRLLGCYLAIKNMVDFPKEFEGGFYQPIYEGSFQGTFRRLPMSVAECVLGRMAVVYREKLREGKQPSALLFVEFADQMCKQQNIDGWDGEEEDPAFKHPEYPEFNNAATPSGRSYGDNVTPRRSDLEYDNRGLVTADE